MPLRLALFKPAARAKVTDQPSRQDHHTTQNYWVAILEMQLGHDLKVHAVDTGKQRQRQKNGCDSGENRQVPVGPVLLVHPVSLPEVCHTCFESVHRTIEMLGCGRDGVKVAIGCQT